MITRSSLALALALALALGVKPLLAQDPADLAWNAGQHDRARELYAQRVAADSSDVRALHRLGLLRGWNGEYAEATQLFDHLLQLTPGDTAVAHARARVLAWAGRLGAAERAYRDLLAGNPSNPEALRGLARVTSWRGDLSAGEALWRKVVAADPDDVDARIGLSQLLRWRGQSTAALAEAEAAVRLAPDNRDAQEQLAWAEAAFAPRIAPAFSAEFDSDDNELITTSLAATAFIARRVGITASGYVRSAEDDRPTVGSVASRAASLGLRMDAGGGWMVGVAGGVNDRRVPGADVVATYSASLATPTWLPLSGSVGYSRSVLDATALLIERGVTIDGADLVFNAQLTPRVRLETAAVLSRFRGSTDNDRLLARLGLDARANSWLRLRPRIRAFWFEDHVSDGYFNPDFYALGEMGFGIDRYRGAWAFNGEVAPGAQQIGSDGSLKAALSLRARVGYSIGPGRDIGLSFDLSNLGIERFETGATGYRYRAAVISGAWAL